MKSIWTHKRTKIIIDICMAIFLVLSFVRWEGDPTFHLIVGTLCTLFFAVHIFIHRKWLKAVTKSYLAKKINPAVAPKYRIDILLLAVWGLCILTGFLALGSFVGGIEWMFLFSRIHGVSARLALVLTIIHIIQHKAQILSYLKLKKKKPAKTVGGEVSKTTRVARGAFHLALHALLHAVSVHLAVLYTLVHLFQHRGQIRSRFKKRPQQTIARQGILACDAFFQKILKSLLTNKNTHAIIHTC